MTPPGAPEGFGGQDQIEILGAARWNGFFAPAQWGYKGGGYIFLTRGNDNLWTDLPLPVGAGLKGIGLIAYDNDTSCGWLLQLARYEAGRGTRGPFGENLLQVTTSQDSATGYRLVEASFTDPVVIRAWEDLDGDGLSNPVVYALKASMLGTCAGDSNMAFFGAEIWWRRTVAPAPATATFNDVPTGHWAFQFVEALAASGITAGCGGGNYCPDDPITRAQMAVYLAAALGLHWPY